MPRVMAWGKAQKPTRILESLLYIGYIGIRHAGPGIPQPSVVGQIFIMLAIRGELESHTGVIRPLNHRTIDNRTIVNPIPESWHGTSSPVQRILADSSSTSNASAPTQDAESSDLLLLPPEESQGVSL
jgi:hypothetical protein